MIIRMPNIYYFSLSTLGKNNFEIYMRNESVKQMEDEKNEDVYSFKFADDEYVNEMTRLHK